MTGGCKMNIAREIINKKTVTLRLVVGETPDLNPFYAYILFPADVFAKISSTNKLDNCQISKYGIVVHSDYGKKPSEELESKILSHFEEQYY